MWKIELVMSEIFNSTGGSALNHRHVLGSCPQIHMRRLHLTKQVPIIEHSDVRRMLVAQKAYAEGATALCLYAAYLFDVTQSATDAKEAQRAGILLDLLTPVVKSWPSEWCLEANKWAIQVRRRLLNARVCLFAAA